MRVARNWRKRRSLMPRISSPTSLMLPPEGTSEPFCSSPITVSDVTDLPEPLSPTRHSVSRLRTCSETPSMIRSLRGFLPRPTTRLSMSRTMSVIGPCLARGAVGWAKARSSRGAHHATPMVGTPSDAHSRDPLALPTLRVGARRSLAALALFHAGIERVAGGVTDQVDGKDRDREQQSRPENQRRLYLKIGAALGHDVAPGRSLRIDAGAEEGQDRLGENRGGADIGALHDQRRDGVRHQMPPHDLR